ncbi:MAG: lipopolysaccharide heptosyltransferase II [Desulfobacterales bacterium]
MKEIFKQFYLYIRKYFLYFLSIFLPHKKMATGKSPDEIQKALFIRIDRIGDLVLSTPALKAFRHFFPDCELSVLASKSNHTVLLNLPYVDKIVTYDHGQNIFKKISTLRRLKKYKYDLVVDPYSGYELKTALIAAYSGAPLRLGYASYGREIFFNVIAGYPENDQHFKDVVINVFKPLGVEIAEATPEINLSEAEKEWSIKWIEQHQVSSRHLVGIHPGAFYESQRWLKESFAEIINRLQENNELEVILFGGPDDEELVKSIASLVYKTTNTYTFRSLRKFIALLSYCNILVCNNSGPLHIATALNLPTVSFIGPTNSARWSPIGEHHKILKVEGLECLGCGQGKCPKGSMACMQGILPIEAFNAVNEMLNS